MILEKRENGLWWFYDAFFTDSFTPYPFGCIIDRSANTFVLTKENRPSYPKQPLPVADVQIRVLPSTSLETYTTAELLENRVLALGFPPLVDGVVPIVSYNYNEIALNETFLGEQVYSKTFDVEELCDDGLRLDHDLNIDLYLDVTALPVKNVDGYFNHPRTADYFGSGERIYHQNFIQLETGCGTFGNINTPATYKTLILKYTKL